MKGAVHWMINREKQPETCQNNLKSEGLKPYLGTRISQIPEIV